MRTLRGMAALALLATAMTVTACGSSSDGASSASTGAATSGAKKLDVVRPVVIQGVQQFPLSIMDSQGIAAKHGIKVEPIKVASPQAAYTQFQTSDFQMGLGAWAKAAQMRAAGNHLTNVFPVFGYTNDILVKKDSPIKSFADLKGKKIGLFGGPGSGTTLLFRLEAVKYFGFDPTKDSKIFFGAPPLLLGQLQKGQLDAALLLDPLITNLISGGSVRSVGNLGTIWKDKTDESPVLVTITMNEDWAKANPDVAKRFVAAFAEAQRYIKTHGSVWKGLGASVGIKTPQAVALLRKRVDPQLYDTFNDQIIQQQLAFAKDLVGTFGKSKDFPSSIPEGTFTTAYAPSGGS